MLHPSYNDLINVVNSNVQEGEDPIVRSRYSIVIATAKRARQLIDGQDPMIDNAEGRKPLSIAVEELDTGAIHITGEDDDIDEIGYTPTYQMNVGDDTDAVDDENEENASGEDEDVEEKDEDDETPFRLESDEESDEE